MNPDSSPFTPGQPVSAEFFTGREQQVEELLTMVRMARTRGLQVGWIMGERGMGKSSLAKFIGYLAERDEKAVVAHVHLGGVSNLEKLAKETHLQLLKDNQTQRWGKKLWSAFGKHIESAGAFGVQFKFKETGDGDTLPTRAGDFPTALSQVVKTAGEDREVLLLTFDDINGLAENPKFPHWLKSMVDGEVTSNSNNPVCLLFVGMEERLQQMVKENPSVIRIFRPRIKIDPWTSEESGNFFRNSFAKGGVDIGENETENFAVYSGGLPIMAHEIGHATWELIKDKKITLAEVMEGMYVAADRVGARFLESDVIQALQSKQYRSILRKIAKHIDLFEIEFSKEQLRSLPFTADEKKNLNNFLSRMRKLGAIAPVKDGQRGVYRFATHLHRMYFFIEASAATNGKRSKKT